MPALTTNDNACGSQSSVTLDTVEGKTYYVGIDGAAQAKGRFAFRVAEGNISQTETCPPPTCARAPFCDIAEDIFVEKTVVASTIDKCHHLYMELEICGFGSQFSQSHEIKAYRFRSGKSWFGDVTMIRTCAPTVTRL